ncbi:phosphate regulon sensor histidine kinase PhoR [Thalassotalea ponticola]|uniref:phosphate regulon sensor histidine kinase PhoR n=1 Tax=Thalassotalea ponticola TaxID=1523392 RepID=UPI0025B515C2|nr:phosphate regulon sensor histidine kinase PhoR [Thalassotalea ponticola]MDN3651773.1 phosphate regulon sensor histidine kinase PhoR [Thalassotalea ponticola]
MIYRFSARQFLVKQLVIFACCGWLGYLFGYMWPALLLCAAVTLILHYRALIGLIHWLWHKNLLYPPVSKGVWGHVYDGFYRRIKGYRKKQKTLSKTIRQYRDGAEALPDAAVVLDLHFNIRWSNKKANRLLNIRWPQDSAQRITNLVRSPELTRYLKKREFNEPCSLVSPDKPEQQLEMRFMPYGQYQYLLLARDVSQLKRIEKMRRDFVANVSHELKTPLTVMRGYVEMMLDEDTMRPHWQKSLQSMEMQVSRMDRLVQQLLVLSKVELNNPDDMEQRINIATMIDNIITEVQWLNHQKAHDIRLNIDSTLDLLGVESEIKSAFSNLIINAINYTDDNGVIEIRWNRKGDECRFSVTDNGCGIAPSDISRLTERFYRVDKSRSRDTGGTGLGLAIVKHVANNHNGELIIDSELGQGSTFVIVFPSSQSIVG